MKNNGKKAFFEYYRHNVKRKKNHHILRSCRQFRALPLIPTHTQNGPDTTQETRGCASFELSFSFFSRTRFLDDMSCPNHMVLPTLIVSYQVYIYYKDVIEDRFEVVAPGFVAGNTFGHEMMF